MVLCNYLGSFNKEKKSYLGVGKALGHPKIFSFRGYFPDLRGGKIHRAILPPYLELASVGMLCLVFLR